ncbi:hypothetical protein PG999_014471 [Apiospora kogelbergensis]|uniref:Uncharacterized protein n=1 Tax=Apiospora kogelbergensis TaxID=1337665 RepID=A0AAW0Q3E5_9PEZI
MSRTTTTTTAFVGTGEDGQRLDGAPAKKADSANRADANNDRNKANNDGSVAVGGNALNAIVGRKHEIEGKVQFSSFNLQSRHINPSRYLVHDIDYISLFTLDAQPQGVGDKKAQRGAAEARQTGTPPTAAVRISGDAELTLVGDEVKITGDVTFGSRG